MAAWMAAVWPVLFVAWGVLASARTLHPLRMKVGITPDLFGLSWEPVSLTARDGVPLSGWFLPHPSPEGALLLLHGFGTCKADLLDIARALRERGRYPLLLVDLRGHGDSGGRRVSFGFQEVLDVRAGLEFLSRRLGSERLPLGCCGLSMGGAVALLAAAQMPQICAVMADSAYADFGRVIASRQRLAYHIPRWLLGQAAIWGVRLRLRCGAGVLDPVRAVGRIAPRSLLLIHGTRDIGIPAAEARALYAAAGDPKELWLVDGAEHAGCFYKAKEEYPRRVLQFFQDAFRRAT